MSNYGDPTARYDFGFFGKQERPREKAATAGLIYKTIEHASVEVRPQGKIRILANSTNVRDMQGDNVLPGAWKSVIAAGQRPRLVVGHDHDTIPVGKATALEEWLPGDSRLPMWHQQNGAGALVADFQINLKSERGQEVYTAIEGGYLNQFSVGFLSDPSNHEYTRTEKRIKAVDLLAEISCVAVGASPGTQPLHTMSASKAGFDPYRYDHDDDKAVPGLSGVTFRQAEDFIFDAVLDRLGGRSRDSEEILRPQESATPWLDHPDQWWNNGQEWVRRGPAAEFLGRQDVSREQDLADRLARTGRAHEPWEPEPFK